MFRGTIFVELYVLTGLRATLFLTPFLDTLDHTCFLQTIKPEKAKICFVCTGNSCRSQIAEAFAKKLLGRKAQIYSAGSKPLGYILPNTVQVMKEAGVNLSGQRSKSLQEVPLEEMDYVISLCDSAAHYCPAVLTKGKRLHWSFPDPYDVIGDEKNQLQAYRDVRDAIEKKLKEWVASGFRLPPG